jgi:tetratricopeptide (TPR) repeat protein
MTARPHGKAMTKTLATVFFLFVAGMAAPWANGANPEWEGLQKSGRWKVLRSQVENRLKADPKNGEALYWRSKALMAFGDGEEAYKAAKESTRLLPQSADAWAQLSASAGLMAARASVLKKMSFATECRDAGKKALELDSKNPLALEVMANFYQHAPSIIGGDKAKADSARAAHDSVDPEAKTRRALRDAYRSGDKNGFEPALKKAMQSHPKAAWPYVEAAQRAMDKNDMRPRDAQAFARAAIENDKYNARAHGYLAQSLAVEEKWAEFDAALASSEKAMPENLHPHYMAAQWLISSSKEPKRAEALLRKYTRQEPEAGAPSLGHAHRALAQALEAQGDRAGAIRELKEASKRLPKDKDSASRLNSQIASDIKRLSGS